MTRNGGIDTFHANILLQPLPCGGVVVLWEACNDQNVMQFSVIFRGVTALAIENEIAITDNVGNLTS